MNGKKARRLRKFVGKEDTPTYTDKITPVWGPLPRNKESKKVDKEKLQKAVSKTDNAKFKGQGFNTLLRYVKGKPLVMKLDCWRKQYQLLKRIHVEVA